MADYWSWLLTAVGLTCFWLAGRKVWWAWYVRAGILRRMADELTDTDDRSK